MSHNNCRVLDIVDVSMVIRIFVLCACKGKHAYKLNVLRKVVDHHITTGRYGEYV